MLVFRTMNSNDTVEIRTLSLGQIYLLTACICEVSNDMFILVMHPFYGIWVNLPFYWGHPYVEVSIQQFII
jgi:hypothetical protein